MTADVFWPSGSAELLDFNTFQTYEPKDVLLTTPDGSELELSLVDGLERIRDPTATRSQLIATASPTRPARVWRSRDGQGQITRITDPMGNTLNYTYDGNGDLVSVTDQVGSVTRFTYNAKHDLLDIIDARGIKATRNEYDATGRLIAVIDADGNRTELAHDIASHKETANDRLSNVTVYEYDNRGNVVKQTDTLGNVTRFTYDARNNMLTKTDPLAD